MSRKIKIIECPRDAMQGLTRLIPTEQKAQYVNSLMKVGFDIIDVGSFVSPKLVPQMADTGDLLDLLNTDYDISLLAIVLNKQGAMQASSFDQIKILGYPLSISEIFQKKIQIKILSHLLMLLIKFSISVYRKINNC